MVTIYALSSESDIHHATEDGIKEAALAFSVGKLRFLDRDPATWHAASTRLLLPTRTALLMLKVSVCRKPVENENLSALPVRESFNGHFVDDVRTSILIRDKVPITGPN